MPSLADFKVYNGVVVDAKDPKKEGRIKAAIPGIFDPKVMGMENLIWISPILPTSQAYSQLVNGDKVIVFHNEANYYEYYYIKNFEMNSNTKELIDNSETDVIVSRTAKDGGNAQVYYKDKEGIVLNVQEGMVKINADGDTRIAGQHKTAISGPQVWIGSPGDFRDASGCTPSGVVGKGMAWESCALGESTKNEISLIWSMLSTIVDSLCANPTTAASGAAVLPILNTVKLTSNPESICSEVVKVASKSK